MNRRGEAKLYYLFMMSDGEVSANEKDIFNTICKGLSIDADEKRKIIKECNEISNVKGIRCIDVLKKNVHESELYRFRDIDLDKFGTQENRAKTLWNLVNLGYSDSHFTLDEREVVNYIKEYWEIPESIYLEMIDVAETCLAIEKQKQWIESLPDSDSKTERKKQVENDLSFVQESIKNTLSEIKF